MVGTVTGSLWGVLKDAEDLIEVGSGVVALNLSEEESLSIDKAG